MNDLSREVVQVGFYIGFNKSFTGGPRTTYNLIRTLDRTRFSPVVITNKHSEFTEAVEGLGIQPIILEQTELISNRGGDTLTGGLFQKLSAGKQLLVHNRAIADQLKMHGVSLLWTRNVKGVMLSGFGARYRRIPVIWDIGMEKPSVGAVRHLHNLAFRLADRVVTQGDSVQSATFSTTQLRQFRRKLLTIESGVAEDRIERVAQKSDALGPPWDPFRIICVGTLNPRKNQLLLLQAISKIFHRHPELRVSLVGPSHDQSYRMLLEAFVSENGLSSIVEILGWRDDVSGLLAKSHLFVLTSSIEGVPQAVMEAMTAGVPVVATAAGGIPDVIQTGKTGWLVDIGDSDGLAKCIEHCLANQHVLPQIAAEAYKVVDKQRTIGTWSSEYQSLFDELLGRRNPRGRFQKT